MSCSYSSNSFWFSHKEPRQENKIISMRYLKLLQTSCKLWIRVFLQIMCSRWANLLDRVWGPNYRHYAMHLGLSVYMSVCLLSSWPSRGHCEWPAAPSWLPRNLSRFQLQRLLWVSPFLSLLFLDSPHPAWPNLFLRSSHRLSSSPCAWGRGRKS